DRRAVGVLDELPLFLARVEDLQEEEPAELAETLGIPVHPDILAHDVLDGLDRRREVHGVASRSIGVGRRALGGAGESAHPAASEQPRGGPRRAEASPGRAGCARLAWSRP